MQADTVTTQKDSAIKESTTSLEDLNHECILELCKYLDLTSQYALATCTEYMYAVIVGDVWRPYHAKGFEMAEHYSTTKAAQIDLLDLALHKFSTVTNINVDIFQGYLEQKAYKELPNVTSLGIQELGALDNKCLKFKEFCRFPNLLHLELSRVSLDFSDKLNTYNKIAFVREILKSSNNLKNCLKFGIEQEPKKIILLSYDEPSFTHQRNEGELPRGMHIKEIIIDSICIQQTETWINYAGLKRCYTSMGHNELYLHLMRQHYHKAKFDSTYLNKGNIVELLQKFVHNPVSNRFHIRKYWEQPQTTIFQKFLGNLKALKYMSMRDRDNNKYLKGFQVEYFKKFMKILRTNYLSASFPRTTCLIR